MKKMKLTTGVLGLLFIMITQSTFSQDIGRINPYEGKSLSNETFATDNYFYIRNSYLNQQLFDFEEAYFSMENAVAQRPQSAKVLLQRAIFKKRFGMITEAEADLRLANLMNPYAADLYGYHGPSSILNVIEFQPEQAVVGLSNYQRVGYYYGFLDKQYGKSGVMVDELVFMEEIIQLMEEERFSEALAILENDFEENQYAFIAFDLKGVIFTKQKKFEQAAHAFSQSVKLQPDFAIAWYNFSRLEKERGNKEIAKTYLDKSIQLEEYLTKAYFDRALLRKELADKEGAMEDYNKVIELNADDYLEAFLNRGLTKSMLGDFNGALVDLNKAIEEFPDNPALYKNRANIYLLFGYNQKAIADYSKAIQLDPFFAEAYFNRGLTHLKEFDMRSGCRDLQKSQDLGIERAFDKLRYFCIE